MYLVTKIRGRRPHKKVDSNEREYSLTALSIPGDVLACQEAHLRVEDKRRTGRRGYTVAGPGS